jgi:hypothetical protein
MIGTLMALLRLLRSETFKLVAMGFMLGSAGLAMTQPSQAQDSTVVASAQP